MFSIWAVRDGSLRTREKLPHGIKTNDHPAWRMAVCFYALRERTAFGGIVQGVQEIVAVSEGELCKTVDASEHTGKFPDT
jgi:hypothetical protein